MNENEKIIQRLRGMPARSGKDGEPGCPVEYKRPELLTVTGDQWDRLQSTLADTQAKLAEADIMKRPRLPPGLPEEMREQVDLLNEQYLRERDILAAERDAKIEAIRNRT